MQWSDSATGLAQGGPFLAAVHAPPRRRYSGFANDHSSGPQRDWQAAKPRRTQAWNQTETARFAFVKAEYKDSPFNKACSTNVTTTNAPATPT